eukprot:3040654-Prymnesium_polylepis.1
MCITSTQPPPSRQRGAGIGKTQSPNGASQNSGLGHCAKAGPTNASSAAPLGCGSVAIHALGSTDSGALAPAQLSVNGRLAICAYHSSGWLGPRHFVWLAREVELAEEEAAGWLASESA